MSVVDSEAATLPMTTESTAQMIFTFSSPGEVFYNQSKNIRRVVVPTLTTDLTILPNHTAMLAVLKPGIVSVFESDENPRRIFVSSGSIAVHPDSSVQVLAEEAASIENLDSKACENALADARRRMELAEDDKQKAEAQIEIDCAEAALRAASDAFQ